MIDSIMSTFENNIRRVRHLIGIYQALGTGRGRGNTNKTDILRASVVMMHSSLEDYFRSIMLWKLSSHPQSPILNNIPIDGVLPATKISLGELLLKHRTKTISELADISIKAYLNETSFNNATDISKSLTNLGYTVTTDIKKLFKDLDAMIKRRHHIVHQADRDHKMGTEKFKVRSITLQQVIKWRKTVDRLILEVNKNF